MAKNIVSSTQLRYVPYKFDIIDSDPIASFYLQIVQYNYDIFYKIKQAKIIL